MYKRESGDLDLCREAMNAIKNADVIGHGHRAVECGDDTGGGGVVVAERRDRTVSRRSKPSSRTTLNGEQPYPWDLLQPQDVMSRHRP